LDFDDNYNIGYTLPDFSGMEKPFFHELKPDFDKILKAAQPHKGKNIILIGNGGAVNSFMVLYRALYAGNQQVTVINSMEPDLIKQVRNKNPKDGTIVITASTSGTNVGVLEIMSKFLDYEMIVITAENDGALRQVAQAKSLPILYVPHITDRYLTSGALAYFPLAVLGIDVRKIDKALHNAYEAEAAKGNSLKLSTILFELEQKGYTEVFVPIYSYKLEAFSIFIMQLMHESVSKEGKGQSFIVVAAPESQHHTNQRFFGGRKNIAGVFICAGQDDQSSATEYEQELHSIKLRDGNVGDISGVPLAKAFSFETEGTIKDAIANKIPVGRLLFDNIREEEAAELIAFWHYMAVYSSWLRGVNPFDQPQVEKSKEIAFEMRKSFH